MMVNMIQEDMIWQNDHYQPAIRELVFIQQQLFNQRIERNKYYGKHSSNNSDMGQETNTNEEWNNISNLERYHVMTESESHQRLNRENPNSSKHKTQKPINENEIDEDDNLFKDEEYRNKNSQEDEEADGEYSERSSSTDYVHLE